MVNNYVIFDRAEVIEGEVYGEHDAFNAVNLSSNKDMVISGEDAAIECILERPVIDEEVKILEIAFAQGRQRRTTFGVTVVDTEGKETDIGIFESTGTKSNFEKFIFPNPVFNIQSVIITFKKNDDMSKYFMVRGIRMAKELTAADRKQMSIKQDKHI